MTIAIGERIPSVELDCLDEGVRRVRSDALFAGKTVLLFAVPGAFTPTCSSRHLPGYIAALDALHARGVDTVACMAVNDAYVMQAWARSQGAPASMRMLADGNAALTRALGLEMDATDFGMGMRSKRFALIAKDGVVERLFVDAPGEFRVSAAEHVLANL